MKNDPFTPPSRLRYCQLTKPLSEHRYIALRSAIGTIHAMNSAVCLLLLLRSGKDMLGRSPFISYYPIDFHTYISHKAPFI